MKITFLGSGTSTGVPVVGCHCPVCTSSNPRNNRLRQSVKIEVNGRFGLIDTTPDLRQQLLRSPIPRLDFILFTHGHSDHIMGLDDIRPFNFRQREAITAFASDRTVEVIRRAFSYIWGTGQVGGGKPQLDLREVDGPFSYEGIDIIPIPVGHGEWTILGYRIGPFAYITDTNSIPDSSMDLLQDLELLAIDALRPSPPHPTHFTIAQSVEAARRIGATRTLLIHLAHEADHDEVAAGLPAGFEPAWDGLEIEL